MYIYIYIHVFKCTYRFRGDGIHGIHEIYDQGMCWSWFVAIATIKEFMFVLVWWLAIYNLRYTWGCEGLWTPQYPPNQPRVIHDWFPKDWIRFWIYHQNNQPEILEIQVHFVPYPDPYPFHTRSIPVPYPFRTRKMPFRIHPPSPPFLDIQVYSTYQIYPTSSLCCSRASDEIMKYRYVHMYFCYICMYLFLYLYLYLNNIILYYIILYLNNIILYYIYIHIRVSPYDNVRIKTLAHPDHRGTIHTRFLSHTHIYIYIYIYNHTYIYIYIYIRIYWYCKYPKNGSQIIRCLIHGIGFTSPDA